MRAVPISLPVQDDRKVKRRHLLRRLRVGRGAPGPEPNFSKDVTTLRPYVVTWTEASEW